MIEQSLKNLIEEYKDVKFLNAGMAKSQDEAYVSAEVYLTGDLIKKLDHAQAAQKTMAQFGDNSLDVNVIALERAIEISKSLLQQNPAIEEDEPLSVLDAVTKVAEKNILVSTTNKELANYAIGEISKRLSTERQRKSALAAEGKPNPIADKWIAVYEEQLSEMRVAKLSGRLNFKSITEKDLLYHVIHDFNEKLYGDSATLN